MRNKHTRGPYHYDQGLIFDNTVMNRHLARIVDGGVDEEEAEANGILFAMAPTMLDGLNEAVLQIEYLHGKFGETGSGNAVLSRLRSIVAKARGETL